MASLALAIIKYRHEERCLLGDLCQYMGYYMGYVLQLQKQLNGV
jgi:hypothetical protein